MPPTPDAALFIDPVSHHFLKDSLFEVNNARLNGDNILAPYAHLRDWFAQRGLPVHTADRFLGGEVRAAKNIYVSMGIRENYRRLARRADVTLSAFFALECPIVEPSLYWELAEAQRHFKRLFSFSDGDSLRPFLRRPLRFQHFYIPQSYEAVHEPIWQRTDRGFLVMINANKMPRVYWRELYTERLRAVEFFSRTGEIDLYGKGWNDPPYRVGRTWAPHTIIRMYRALLRQWDRLRPDPLLAAARRVYRGTTLSKAETLGRYTFALCFENMILRGWITEKIFDCFFAGTIPIYWGAPDIQAHVPEDCFIDMRRFSDYPELRRYLKSLSGRDIRAYRESGRAYLQSPRFRPFTQEAFVALFCRIVAEDAGVQL